ncbi:hypothetical protein UFOVP331_12 [uncultured Caudovirales phage]|uniref:Uncharacterized protein n=1 Tax=uncultured Caudovirales phage TaxID=2100421 RepID=A0A6J5LV81_9CAUD|nr:hypothetical protein UFOVP331_12 [uncultured Caudovirales phage]
METKVLTQDELQQIKDIQQDKSVLVEQFGIIEYRIQDLKQQKQSLNLALSDLKQKEIDLGKMLQERYGDGTINVEKGEFTSSL